MKLLWNRNGVTLGTCVHVVTQAIINTKKNFAFFFFFTKLKNIIAGSIFQFKTSICYSLIVYWYTDPNCDFRYPLPIAEPKRRHTGHQPHRFAGEEHQRSGTVPDALPEHRRMERREICRFTCRGRRCLSSADHRSREH